LADPLAVKVATIVNQGTQTIFMREVLVQRMLIGPGSRADPLRVTRMKIAVGQNGWVIEARP
jgi:exosome complex RNA-binding protein Rrp4